MYIAPGMKWCWYAPEPATWHGLARYVDWTVLRRAVLRTLAAMNRVSGRSGAGLLGFAILAIVAIVVVAAVAFSIGHQLAVAEKVLAQVPRP